MMGYVWFFVSGWSLLSCGCGRGFEEMWESFVIDEREEDLDCVRRWGMKILSYCSWVLEDCVFVR